jgi:arylsulfatase A-like enzyme
MEPHEGYDAPGKTPYERYIGEVKKVDAALQPLVDLTESPELRDRLVVILSADHGEAFGEHGTKFHAVTLYEELIRVPLFVHIPGVKPRRDDTPVAGMDIGPTVLDLFGVPIPGSNMGQSLAPLIAGKGARTLTRPLVADSGRRMQAMIFDGRYKVIRDLRQGTVELYDLKDDPGELKNLSDEKPELTKDLHGRMASFFDVHTYRKKGYEVPYRP